MNKGLSKKIPDHIIWVLQTLQDAGFESYIVGGCVRDLFLEKKPNDFDITTNAIPQEIIELFEEKEMKVVYENNFGTVVVINKNLEKNDICYEVEITPYRTEGNYTDSRRPDNVSFSHSIHEDVKRRDFTINAMAFDPIHDVLVDDFAGLSDLENRIIRTVGDSQERFSEDALRIMRAVRFSAQLGFMIDEQTIYALRGLAQNLEKISHERIRDEFIKLIDAPFAKDGVEMLRLFGLLDYIIPEFLVCVGCEQGGAHHFDVWTHLIKSLEHASNKNYPIHVKISALFHDIGKPQTRRLANGRGTKKWTFYGHEVVGAKITEKVLKRLKFSKEITEKVVKLVRYHMFFSDPDAITLSATRRMVRNVGKDLVWDLMDLRTCDRIGTGVAKEKSFRLRKYHTMIEQVLRDPISVKMLKLNGDIMISEMGMKPGKKMGWILHALLEEVLDDPKKNTREYLEKRALEMEKIEEDELQKLGESGRDKKDETEFYEIKKIERKHKVG